MTPPRSNEGVEQQELPRIAGGSATWQSLFGVWQFLTKLNRLLAQAYPQELKLMPTQNPACGCL